jgi:hypothetical protein
MTMADLISRAAAIDAIVSVTVFPDADYIKNLCENPANSEDWLGGVCDAINAVEDVNTVDAVPVIHARWILIQNGSGVCSACNRNDHIDSLAAYCRYCGAKMDGERRGDDGSVD